MASVLFDRSKLERLRGVFDTARTYWFRAFELTVGFRAPGMLTEGMTYLCEILLGSARQLELAYEPTYFVAEHPSSVGGIKVIASARLQPLDGQLTEDVRQAAIARAQAHDLDTYCCDLLQSECASWSE